MRAKRTKTNAFDWAAIRWARLREENERVDEPSLEPKKNERGRLVDPIGYLSERAEKLLSDSGVSAVRFRERVLFVWFFSLVLVAALGAVVFPFARADRLLGGGGNLAGPFVFFLLGQIFFLATSLIFVGIALFQSFLRLFRKKDAPRTFAEKAVERLCGLIGWFALIGLREGIRGFYALCGGFSGERSRRSFFGRKKNDENSSEKRDSQEQETKKLDERREKESKNANDRKVAFLFLDSIFSKPRFLFFWGGVLSHLFWASCSFFVLLILAARMQGNRYDYCWRTSLEDERVVKKCVDFLGYPLAKLGVSVPTEEDARRLFVSDRSLQTNLDTSFNEEKNRGAPVVVVLKNESKSDAAAENATKTETKTRALWSRFLLGVVFVWCVVPRCLLVGAYYFLLRRSLRDFRPDLNDPYFKKLIDRAEAYSSTTRSAPVDDPFDDQNDAENSTKSQKQEEKRDAAEKNADKNDGAPTPERDANRSIGKNETVETTGEQENFGETPKPTPTPPIPRIATALGYDATLSAKRWNDLFDPERAPVVFGDVAADFELKRRFQRWARENGAAVDVGAVVVDVSLSPARHCVKFLRQELGDAFPNARIFVVLSGGEKLRRKFGATATRAVAERVADWRDVLAELTRTTGVSFAPIFFFDAELDLPEPRERLRRLLTRAVRGENVEIPEVEIAPENFAKWDAAAARIDAESRRIFDENDVDASESERDERDRHRVASLLADVFAIYREETETFVAESKARDANANAAESASILKQFSKIGETTGALGVSLTATLAEKGIDVASLEKNLARAVGLSAKMRQFCGKLSPKCALAAGALGVSAPLVATFAPLFGGALTATALASTFGTFLPTAFASGATGAALGAFAPLSLSACKKKLVEKWRGLRSQGTPAARGTRDAETRPVGETPQNGENAPRDETVPAAVATVESVESVAATVCAATTWAVALELQGWPEDKIVAALPVATRPLETSPLDAPETVRRALDDVRDEIRKLRELEKSRG